MTYEHVYAQTDREQIEREIVGRMLLDAKAIPLAQFYCETADFVTSAMRGAFDAMTRMHSAGASDFGVVSVTREMTIANPELNFQKTASALLFAQNQGATSANIEHFCRIFVDIAERARIALAAKALVDMPNDESIERVEQVIRELSSSRKNDLELMADVMDQRYDEIAAEAEGEIIRKKVPTGIEHFDSVGGMPGGELWVLGARPRMGKSALALQLADHAARASGPRGTETIDTRPAVLFFSLEMLKRELADRLIVRDTGIELGALRTARLSADDWMRFNQVSREFRGVPLYTDDTPRMSLARVVAACERFALQRPVAMVIVDYLQLVKSTGGRAETREQEVGNVSRELKQLAKSLDAPVLALAQLNRSLEQRPDKRPSLSDLRDSGAIEQDADVVLMLYREHVYDDQADPRGAELIVAKHRHFRGDATVNLDFDGASYRFTTRHP